MERKKITFDSFIRGVILGVIIIGILMLLKRLSSVLLPFFIAWLIAYLVYPLVTFFQYKLKLRNRIVSIFCALLTLLIVGAGAFYLFFINSIFISFSTFIGVRLLKYKRKIFLDKKRETTVKKYIMLILFLTILPSSYSAKLMIDKIRLNREDSSYNELVFFGLKIIIFLKKVFS